LGIQVDIDVYSPNTNQRILEEYITKKSSDKTVHGILLESPFPD
jgi:5,10-methylene-tetrahydrofolate dehydrogenase/methenyl tetrahydrofolate cyclohydrolase